MKKSPMRKCTGCGEMKDKRQLMRIVRSPEGVIEADFTGKKNGRGCYICKNKECLCMAKKGKRLERSFKQQISAEIYDVLEKALEEADNGNENE